MALTFVINGTSAVRWTCPDCDDHRTDNIETVEFIQARHVCKGVNVDNTKTVILSCWEELDATIDLLMPHVEALKNAESATIGAQALVDGLKMKARGMAEIMAHWTVPHFRTADEVAKEAMVRYRARKAGEEHHTPGTVIALAGADLAASYERQGVSDKPSAATIATIKRMAGEKKVPPAPVKITVSPKDQLTIKHGKSSGMFTEAELAMMYKISEAEVRAIIAS